METLHTRRNSHFDVDIICVPEYFCLPVDKVHDLVLGEYCFKVRLFLYPVSSVFQYCTVSTQYLIKRSLP